MRWFRFRALTVVCWMAVSLAAAGQPLSVELGPNRVDILKDFVADFSAAAVTNALTASASYDERCGRVSLPGLFLHPKDAADAAVSFEGVAVPQNSAGTSSFLLFRIGLRDGIPWGTPENKANGARFSVLINGQAVFQEDLAKSQWQARSIDMLPYSGQTVSIEFHTNSMDNNPSYDWCVFGQPILVNVTSPPSYRELAEDSVGVALAQIECVEPASVTVAMGGASESAALAPGIRWIPIHFPRVAELTLTVNSGNARLNAVFAAAYAPQLHVREFALSSSLVTAAKPFSVIANIKNAGLGNYAGGLSISLTSATDAALSGLGENAAKAQTLGKLAPQQDVTLTWPKLAAAAEGDWVLTLGDRRLSFHVYPPEPPTRPEHPATPEISITPNDPIRATVANAWSRLNFVVNDTGDAYAIANTWNGTKWLPLGSMHPLAALAVRHADGSRERLTIRVTSFDSSNGGRDGARPSMQGVLQLHGEAASSRGAPWPLLVTYAAAPDSARIQMTYTVTPQFDAEILAFYGPNVLAGDRGFGAKKDFALFPGLEYLQGDEDSSSSRDLSYPLSDRRVPAAYKITTPLMAVQSEGALIALLWNANQEWAPGKKHPAARFAAPKIASGYERILMALFAPSVGDHVLENRFEASAPYPIKSGQPLSLSATLVLDHASRYDAASLVHGPHGGGLVLQAIKHWTDIYGLPAPSPQPREWEVEKDLCRHAYLNSIWVDNPPGWSHCQGWPSLLSVGQAVPLLLDLRQGMPEDVRAEIEQRIQLVINRAIAEKGQGFLWESEGCHIMKGELPYYYGYAGEAMRAFRDAGLKTLEGREKGQWVWRPQGEQHAQLGTAGDHTLGQAAWGAYMSLRAARLSGAPELRKQALDAMKQMELYDVPRGAQTWECPLYQPDILAAAQAIRAYCEAYRLTGDEKYIHYARYWGWTGLPFLYLWDLEGYPTMRYNSIAVFGSTFFTHSWLGQPVVWCGLVYAYALQDLAEFDQSFDWKRVAQGITNSAMWQQYTEGPSRGCYPDSWNMVRNTPSPADINPENIVVNEFRLRGLSPEIRTARFPAADEVILLNSAADIVEPAGGQAEGAIRFGLKSVPGFPVYTLLAPVKEPSSVGGPGVRVAGSDDLQTAPDGWYYDAELRAVIFKNTPPQDVIRYEVRW